MDILYRFVFSSGRYSAGQNLAAATGTHSWTDRIDSWQSEVSRFQMGTGATDGGDVGHYTQVLSAFSLQN